MTGPPLSQGLDPALHCMIVSFNNLEIVQCIVLDLFTLKYTYTETTSNSESGFLTPKRSSRFLLSKNEFRIERIHTPPTPYSISGADLGEGAGGA